MSPSIMLRQPALPRRLMETAAEIVRTRVPTWLLVVFPLLPSVVWYGRRLNDGSDEPYGLIPLLLAGLFAWRDRRYLTTHSAAHAAGAVMILLSALLIPNTPPMIRAALALAGTGFMLGFHGRPALLGLLAL
jgi:hypothetical protein